MNILLLSSNELNTDNIAHLDGRRAEHVHLVLRAKPGARLRAGLVDGPIGEAEVLETTRRSLVARFSPLATPPAPSGKSLILALPRPKVLNRCLEHAATLGFGRIWLVRTARVERSQLASRALDPASMRRHLLLGLEQGRRTQVPELQVFTSLAQLLANPELQGLPSARIVADLDGRSSGAPVGDLPYSLVIGPEGGLLAAEVATLGQHGFVPRAFGATPLRVESALSYVAGQLELSPPQLGSVSDLPHE